MSSPASSAPLEQPPLLTLSQARDSGDAAMALRQFWQQVDPNTGLLQHDFTDREWNTRFLGDLYQDLSEATRKRYALLQTPEYPSCAELQQQANQRANAILRRHAEQERQYDQQTGHGRSQGAWLMPQLPVTTVVTPWLSLAGISGVWTR